MYNLEQLKDRVIWLFREPRSGSTWLTAELVNKLKRKSIFASIQEGKDVWGPKRKPYISAFFDSMIPKDDDNTKLFHTHEFDGLENVSKYNNPILIRVIRRNRTDHFCSQYFATKLTNVYNVHTEQQYNQLPKIDAITIPIDNIEHSIHGHKKKELLWNQYSTPYENETIYYEDLLEGTILKLFDIGMIGMNIKNVPGRYPKYPIKLPYNYKELVVNYDEIDSIMKNHFDF